MAQSPYSSSPNVDDSRDPGPGGGDAAQQPLPDLDNLVSHLVAAKRSLSSINHVWRANEIVTAARGALKESVILSARTGFLRRGLDEQIRLLYDVRHEVEEVANRGRNEFSAALQELDSVDEQLRSTLDILKDTTVEPAFRPTGESLKTLHDFIDEHAVDEVQVLLKEAIDKTNAAQTDLEESNAAFDDELHVVQKVLRKYAKKDRTSSQSVSHSSLAASGVNAPTPSLFPELLQSLESHAQEMADLLQSLVRHYDLCVTAVKHTEGGGAAFRHVAGENHTGADDGRHEQTEDGEEVHPLEPLTDSEYQEMLTVIAKDAPEANDVVFEIQERIAEMETTFEHVMEQRDAFVSACMNTTGVFHRLSNFATQKLPGYVAQTHVFMGIWREQRERIESGMADLTDLREMYIGFLDAYDGLILEAARRKSVRKAVEKVLREARAKLDKLYEDDLHARETFRVEQGDYLPSDIWPGLESGPVKIEFKRMYGGEKLPAGEGISSEGAQQEENGTEGNFPEKYEASFTPGEGDSLPDLPRQVVERALERVKMRGKASHIPR